MKRLVRRIFPHLYQALGRGRTVLRASSDVRLAWSAVQMFRLSASHFDGWMTSHATRWWEYPWVLRHAKGLSGRAVDFGAGKSPMPIALAQSGFEVDVVDPDTLQGEYENEWEWLDYGRWCITTHRAGMENSLYGDGELDLAVSVSVIEHLPAETRRQSLGELGRQVKSGGRVVITVDVLPGTEQLWNRVVDEVEPLDEHGTVTDMLDEARRAGLHLVHIERCPIRLPQLEAVGLVFTVG